MKKMKALLAIGITLIFIATAFPVTALPENVDEQQIDESLQVEALFTEIERIASESTSYEDFIAKLRTFFERFDFTNPTLQAIYERLLSLFCRDNEVTIGENLKDLADKIRDKMGDRVRPDYLVISHGSYNRINPKKDNTINIFKERLSFWHYGSKSKLFDGKTLIIARHPFEIKQNMKGPQFGMMKGFRGLYIDYESKLTGNSYVFFIGHASHIRAFDLNPFSK